MYREQWELLIDYERAIQLIFWEVVSAHTGVIKNVDLFLRYFTYTFNLLEVVFALGAIADIHGANDCVLVWKLTNIPTDGYSPGKRVILSLDCDGLNFWEPANGCFIVSWRWLEVSGIYKDEKQQTLTFRIFVAPGQSNDSRGVTIKTASHYYLFSLSKMFMTTYRRQKEKSIKLPRPVDVISDSSHKSCFVANYAQQESVQTRITNSHTNISSPKNDLVISHPSSNEHLKSRLGKLGDEKNLQEATVKQLTQSEERRARKSSVHYQMDSTHRVIATWQ